MKTYKVTYFDMPLDFTLLQKQKQTLLNMLDGENPSVADLNEALDGLVNHIDYLQDRAVDTKQVPEGVVFPRIKPSSYKEKV